MSMRRSPFQALSAIFVLSLTFFVTTLLILLVYASSQVLTFFETQPQIVAYLKDDVSDEKVQEIKARYESDSRVRSVNYFTKEQALERYKKATADNPLLTQLVNPRIFPASLDFNLHDLKDTSELFSELRGDENIEDVGFTGSLENEEQLIQVIDRLQTASRYIRIGGGSFVIFLVSTSLLVLIVIIGMRMVTRKGEIEILDLIGATPGFIRAPIFIESIFYGLFGTFLGWFLALLLILYSTPTILSYFRDIPILPRDPLSLLSIFGMILGAELVIAFFLVLFGTSIALSRAKKR